MISVSEEFPGENDIHIAPEFLNGGEGLIEVKGRNNTIHIGRPGSIGYVTVLMTGDCRLTIDNEVYLHHQYFHLLAPSSISIGWNTSFSVRTQLNTHETGSISIGEGCLIAGDVTIACSDVHKILDVETKERLNPPGDIVIEDHVWLAAHVSVWGNTRIGSHSVVGYNSFVRGEFPPNSLIAGIPARVIRRGITWEQ